jgi:uncharacterized membrane protein YfcA
MINQIIQDVFPTFVKKTSFSFIIVPVIRFLSRIERYLPFIIFGVILIFGGLYYHLNKKEKEEKEKRKRLGT